MLKLYSVFIVLLLSLGTFAQPYETNPDFNRANHWFVGDSVWLDFNYSPPHNRNGSQLRTTEPSASYSKGNGDLLVYSNGLNIWNNKHEIIQNGTGILGHLSSRQGAIFIPQPKKDSILFLFTTDASCGNNGLRYSKIRLHENPDSFIVIEKNVFVANELTESINVTKHSNNTDYWIVVHSSTGNTFYSYLLTEEGLISCPTVTQIGYIYDGHSINCQTSGDFNLQNNKFVYRALRDFKVMTLDFSSSTGKFSNYKQYDDIPVATGLTFSTNNSYIYVVERDRGIRRINLTDNTYDTITQINPFDYLIIQTSLTPHGDIYCNILDSNHVASISNIDSVTPGFNLKAISVGSKKLTNGLPNFVKSYFHTPSINFDYEIDCISNTVQFQGQDTFQANSHSWEITKIGLSPITANSKAPLIQFNDTGMYVVQYIASNGGRSDTLTKEINILPKIDKDFLGNDTGWCDVIGTAFNLQAPSGMHCYEWSNGSTSASITADTIGEYWVKITTPNFCVVYDTLTVSKDTLPNIETDFLGDNINWCENMDTSVSLQAPTGFISYLWNTGETTNQIQKDTAGIYSVEITTSNYCKLSDTISIILDTLPNVASNFLGNDFSWCENLDTSVILSAPTDMLSYIWNTGSTSTQIQIDTAGTYRVTVTAHNHCVISDTIQVSIDTLPNFDIGFLGDNINWCENLDTSVNLSAPADMLRYIWNTGDTTQGIDADSEGIYLVSITAHNLCVFGDTITISLDTVPHNPIIYKDKDTLKTNTIVDLYQWYRYEIPIGNNQDYLIVSDTGVYKLTITNSFGCSAFSDTLHVPDTANINVSTIIFEGIKIHPNPFESKLIISNQNNNETDLKIYDINGKVIYNEKLASVKTINTDRWVAGIYLIKITLQNGNSRTYKLIKNE